MDNLFRIRHSGQGEPYLHVEGDCIAVPGDAKCVSRVLLYNKVTRTVQGVRDLDHKKFWVLGAQLENTRLLTLSLFAYGTNTTRELRLWNIIGQSQTSVHATIITDSDGVCERTLVTEGGVAGFPALRYPHVFLSGSQELQVWDITTATKLRTIRTNICGYHIKNQFLFILNKQADVKLFKMSEVLSHRDDNDLWRRTISWRKVRSSGETIPRLSVGLSRLLITQPTKSDREFVTIVRMCF